MFYVYFQMLQKHVSNNTFEKRILNNMFMFMLLLLLLLLWLLSSSIVLFLSEPTQHSHFYRDSRGVARLNIITSIVVAAEWPDATFSLLSWWPQSGPTRYSHFYHRGRGVARSNILTSTAVVA